MQYNLSIIESDNEINKLILKNLLPVVNKRIDYAITNIIRLINLGLENSIKNQDEYRSLIDSNGKLRAEFGINDISLVDNAIETIIDSVYVQRKNITISNNGLVGGFLIGFLPYKTILNSAYRFSVITEKGQELPWLKWLLFDGISSIVKNYDVKFGYSQNSRTGNAIMIRSEKSWRVPPEFAGTFSDNWFTRAVDNIDDSIESIILKSMKEDK